MITTTLTKYLDSEILTLKDLIRKKLLQLRKGIESLLESLPLKSLASIYFVCENKSWQVSFQTDSLNQQNVSNR